MWQVAHTPPPCHSVSQWVPYTAGEDRAVTLPLRWRQNQQYLHGPHSSSDPAPNLLVGGHRFSVLRWITTWRDLPVSAEFQEKVQYCAKQCSSNLESLTVFTSRDPVIYCRLQPSKDLVRAHGVSHFLYNTKFTSLRLLHWHSVPFYLHSLVISTKPWPFSTAIIPVSRVTEKRPQIHANPRQ